MSILFKRDAERKNKPKSSGKTRHNNKKRLNMSLWNSYLGETLRKISELNLERILNMRDTGQNREMMTEIRNQAQLSGN